MEHLKWEIGVLLELYTKRKSKLNEFDFNGQKHLKDLYAQAIILNLRHGLGIFYPIDDFIDEVRDGGIIAYDGTGYLINSEGQRMGYARCNVQFLEEEKANGTAYVAWFHK